MGREWGWIQGDVKHRCSGEGLAAVSSALHMPYLSAVVRYAMRSSGSLTRIGRTVVAISTAPTPIADDAMYSHP